MARINLRASSAAGPDDEDVRQLDQARQQNDQKLKSRFERIFRKYEHNFEGVGDEIDIHSGEIVVDNGHLQHMRDEADPGKSASSRFVRTFQEKLEHEGDGEGNEEEGGSESGEDEESEDPGSDDGHSDGDDQSNDSQSTIEPFRALTRPPPRLAQLLVGGTNAVEDTDDQMSQDPSLAEDGSGVATPMGLLEQIPALRDSMSALTARSRRPAVDADTIQALGTTIANQLAQLMAGPSKKKKRRQEPRSRRVTTDPVWDFPDIQGKTDRQKRKRSPHSLEPPPLSSPPIASPGQRSLWAPEGSRQSKRFRKSATPSLRRLRSSIIPSSAVRGSDLKRCTNCSLTNSAAWQVGPGGEDLCVACGKYYDHHGRMKPFDSPTPSVQERDSSVEPVSEIDIGEPFLVPAVSTEEDALTQYATGGGSDEVSPQVSVNHHYMPPPSPAHDDRSEVVAMQSVVPRMLPGPAAVHSSAPAQKFRSKSQVTPEPMFIMETPGNYSANTSRQLLSATKGGPYSIDEDALIIKLKEQYNLPWHVAALQLPQRTLFSIQNRYTRALHNTDCAGRDVFNAQRLEEQLQDAAFGQLATPGHEMNWSHEQDELLLELREEKELDWDEIASVLPAQSAQAVEARYEELVLEAENRREQQLLNAPKAWSTDEDARIVRLKEIDKLAWHHVAERFESRSMQSIQKRYSRCLAPEKRKRAPSDLTQGTTEELILEADPELAASIAPGWRKEPPFEPAEDELIKRMVNEADGLDWAKVAAQLPGRSPRSVYVRYTGLMNNEVENSGVKAPLPTPMHAKSIRRTDTPPNFGDYETVSSAMMSPSIPDLTSSGSWRPWVQAEDDIIMRLKASHNASWEDISLRLPHRNASTIAQRFSELIHAMPTIQMATHTTHPAPTPLQVMDTTRRSTSSRSALEVRPYALEEDDLIIKLRAEGTSWGAMAHNFRNRAPGSLKEHWSAKLQPKARKSLPAPNKPRAGLLRTALSNSRRRSDAQPKSYNTAAMNGAYGSADDPIMFEDDAEMAAASEQLFEEFRSSVVEEPSQFSQIDPQLLALDLATLKSRGLQRLILAAKRCAVEQKLPDVVQQISQVYHGNADDPRLQQLLQLTAHNGNHTPRELESAFEAFDHAHRQYAQSQWGIDISAERVSEVPLASTSDRGKGKARELGTIPHSLHTSPPAQISRPLLNPSGGQSQAREMAFPLRAPIRFSTAATDAHMSLQQARAPTKSVAPPRIHASAPAPSIPIPHVIFSDNDDHNVEPPAAFLSAGKAAEQVLPQRTPEKRAPREHSTNQRKHQSTSASEELLGVPSHPEHSPSELIRMALEANPTSAMHPKRICTWLERNFEWYRVASPGWQSNILTELNSNNDFEQCGTGRSRPWRVKAPAVPASPRPVKVRNGYSRVHDIGGNASIPHNDPADDYAENSIIVDPPRKKRGRPRGKRTTDSVRDAQEYRPAKPSQQPSATNKVPTRGRRNSMATTFEDQKTIATPLGRELDLTIVIADSDGGDELSSSPAQQLPQQSASSGKRVRFVETVEVRGPAPASAAHATPSNKSARPFGESDTREPDDSSSSPAKAPGTGSSIKEPARNVKEAVPSSSPVFMKPAIPNVYTTNKSKSTFTPTSSISTPLPPAKNRLMQLRRESISAAFPTPEMPKTNWPRRNSTPTAIFSHRMSPALGRGVMVDRFGFGRKRVVETPVREMMEREDVEEDELA